jgi:hypothetical protein
VSTLYRNSCGTFVVSIFGTWCKGISRTCTPSTVLQKYKYNSCTSILVQGSQPKGQRTPDWVSLDTWRLIDQRASLKCQGIQYDEQRHQLIALNTRIRKNIRCKRKLRTMKAGSEIKQMLNDKDARVHGPA